MRQRPVMSLLFLLRCRQRALIDPDLVQMGQRRATVNDKYWCSQDQPEVMEVFILVASVGVLEYLVLFLQFWQFL